MRLSQAHYITNMDYIFASKYMCINRLELIIIYLGAVRVRLYVYSANWGIASFLPLCQQLQCHRAQPVAGETSTRHSRREFQIFVLCYIR